MKESGVSLAVERCLVKNKVFEFAIFNLTSMMLLLVLFGSMHGVPGQEGEAARAAFLQAAEEPDEPIDSAGNVISDEVKTEDVQSTASFEDNAESLSAAGKKGSADFVASSSLQDVDIAGSEADKGFGFWRIVRWILLLVIVGFLCFWGLSIYRALAMHREYKESLVDLTVDLDERLQSELSTLEVVLLRSNEQSYYEKVLKLTNCLLDNRKLIKSQDLEVSVIMDQLRAADVDPVFLDSIESILFRCDNVLSKSEQTNDEDKKKIVKDLRTLIRMRPRKFAVGKKDSAKSIDMK